MTRMSKRGAKTSFLSASTTTLDHDPVTAIRYCRQLTQCRELVTVIGAMSILFSVRLFEHQNDTSYTSKTAVCRDLVLEKGTR